MAFILLSLSYASAKRVGVYCFFENTGQQLYEDDKIQIVTMCVDNGMKVAIQNKTSEIIYIDKANSFVYINGTPVSLFKNSAHTTNVSETSGTSFNMGGVARALGLGGALGALMGATTVGGATTTSDATIIYEQRILAIAPHSAEIMYTCGVSLSPNIIDEGVEGGRLTNLRWGSDGKFIDPHTGRVDKFRIGMSRNYNQTTTPFELKFVTTYSTEESFQNKQLASINHYISDIVIDKRKGVKKMMKGQQIYLPYCAPYLAQGLECYKFTTGSAPFATIAGAMFFTVATAGSITLAVLAIAGAI